MSRANARLKLAQAEQALKSTGLEDVYPACSSEGLPDDAGSSAMRVFFYAAGLMGDARSALSLAVRIERLHRREDGVFVVTSVELTEEEIENLHTAVTDVLGGGQLHIVAPNSQLWDKVWNRKSG